MDIDWAALGQVFGVSLVVTVAIVGVFTLGIVGTSRKPAPDGADGGTAVAAGGHSALVRAGAYLCYAVCAAGVGYGIHLIVSG
ncbi:hypothetical protein IHE55_05220 [Streptomyces pactum]|uniref:Secreted protein n=1 Tax=Streptomyces pactum TaxID=68249 RepID=A0ABS0NGC0_9ACTN|nr:hypothetical protein [Streptomyces pactum]MBH5334235.1 hypothetical protein [Streptomyces pactum]